MRYDTKDYMERRDASNKADAAQGASNGRRRIMTAILPVHLPGLRKSLYAREPSGVAGLGPQFGDIRCAELRIRPDVSRSGCEQLFLAIHKIAGIECRNLKTVPVSNGVRRAGLDTVPAEYAAVIVDVVNLRVSLCATNAFFCRVLRGFDINTVRRTGCRTKETCDALLQPIFVTLQYVNATKTLLENGTLQRTRTIRIVLDQRRLEHFAECH